MSLCLGSVQIGCLQIGKLPLADGGSPGLPVGNPGAYPQAIGAYAGDVGGAVDPRAAALSLFAQFQVTETTVGEALQGIADVTVHAVAGADIVGMSMLGDDGRPTTAVYTDSDSPAIDEVQYREGKGPCLDAWRANAVVRLRRVQDSADTYPGFAKACCEHGVLSTLSLPMTAGHVALGAVNLYARDEDAFSKDDESVAGDLAVAGAAVLLNVSAYWTAFDLTTQLSEAMASRAVIEQAKGVLMAGTAGLTADAAFELLRSVSQRENLKLRAVAMRIVEGRGRSPGGKESSHERE
jgi:transcriptional regulator with GAF, ATPase, and Fis domain